MSVPVQDPINQIVIVGGETLIPWTWNLQLEGEITVLVQRQATGLIDTLTLNADYTVEANDLDNDNGGNITPIGSESPVTTGDIWTMFRVTAIDRSPDFATSGAFLAKTINEQLDELTRICQDIGRDSAEAVRKDPGVGDELDRNIPQMVDRRCLVFEDTGGGNFEMVMSEFDPDTTAQDAQDAADASAASAAQSAQSSSDSQDSADAAAISETNAAQSASDSQDSADDAAASAAAAVGLYAVSDAKDFSDSPIVPIATENGVLFPIDTSGGNVVINLSTLLVYATDIRFAFIKITADANTITINRGGTNTINGIVSLVISREFESATIAGDVATGKWVNTTPVIDAGNKTGSIGGLNCSNAADPSHDVLVAVGFARDFTDVADIVLSSPITKQIDAAWAVGNDAGGLDTGTVAANIGYGIYLIRRSDTGVVDVIFSTDMTSSGATLTLPANYDQKRLIGWVRTDANANIIAFLQSGDLFTLLVQPLFDVNDSTIVSGVYETATLTTPPLCEAKINFLWSNVTSTDNGVTLSLRTTGSNLDSGSNASYMTTNETGDWIQLSRRGKILTNASGQVDYAGSESSGSTTLQITIVGCNMLTRTNP